MNWFTRRTLRGEFSTEEQAKKVVARYDGCCEHVEANPMLAFGVTAENDSFGSESYCMCEACWDKQTEEEEDEEHVCFDCKKKFKLKDGVLWKWYDFYAPQGDEPLPICNECAGKEKHLTRVRKDRADLEEELSRP